MYRTVFWTLWEREEGMIWENGIKTCIISYKKRKGFTVASIVNYFFKSLVFKKDKTKIDNNNKIGQSSMNS